MSTIIYLNNHFYADRAIRSSEANFIDLTPIGKGKLYLSPENLYAVACVGIRLSENVWNSIYGVVLTYLDKKNQYDFSILLESCDISLKDRHILFATQSNLVEIYNEKARILDRKCSYALGSGCYAARVLLQSGKKFNGDEWFYIISQADHNVSREYEEIDLSILGTIPSSDISSLKKKIVKEIIKTKAK